MTKTMEERMDAMERKMDYYEATRGTFHLRARDVASIWGVIVSLLVVGASVLKMGWQLEKVTLDEADLRKVVYTHVESPGHAVSLDRINTLITMVQDVKDLMEEHIAVSPYIPSPAPARRKK